MINWNSILARHSDPIVGSWITHGVGTAASLAVVLVSRNNSVPATTKRSWPRWIYLGGVAGALAVLLAAIAVNGPLGLAGTLALMLTGQLLFTIAVDHYGWLGLEKRPTSGRRLAALMLIAVGSLLIIGAQPL